MSIDKNGYLKAGRELLKWYRKVKRDLPWRENKDGYRIWISEVMLQQTQVNTVKPYYQRFLEKFPTAESLAYASEEEVLSAWQGLGYYSRARNLQAGVREMVEQYGGVLPQERKSLESLRGIGPYTAGALLSVVYDLPEPAIDGNVFRVITRFTVLEDFIDLPKTRHKVSEIVLKMMTTDAAGDFNQGLMELGATVCTPQSPKCEECPIKKFCEGYRTGTSLDFPKKKKARRPKEVQVFCGVLFSGENVLLRKRPDKGLLASMWEFPSVEAENSVMGLKKLEELFLSLGVLAEVKDLQCGVSHIFSHRVWDLKAYQVVIRDLPPKLPTRWQWHPWDIKKEVLWAGPHKKVADYLMNE